jgi:hypothetical protein
MTFFNELPFWDSFIKVCWNADVLLWHIRYEYPASDFYITNPQTKVKTRRMSSAVDISCHQFGDLKLVWIATKQTKLLRLNMLWGTGKRLSLTVRDNVATMRGDDYLRVEAKLMGWL